MWTLTLLFALLSLVVFGDDRECSALIAIEGQKWACDNLEVMNGTSEEACASFCCEDDQCSKYNYYDDDGLCELKVDNVLCRFVQAPDEGVTGVTLQKTMSSAASQGSKHALQSESSDPDQATCARKDSWNRAFWNCRNTFIINGTSEENCFQACCSDDTCKGYTYHSDTGLCQTKSKNINCNLIQGTVDNTVTSFALARLSPPAPNPLPPPTPSPDGTPADEDQCFPAKAQVSKKWNCVNLAVIEETTEEYCLQACCTDFNCRGYNWHSDNNKCQLKSVHDACNYIDANDNTVKGVYLGREAPDPVPTPTPPPAPTPPAPPATHRWVTSGKCEDVSGCHTSVHWSQCAEWSKQIIGKARIVKMSLNHDVPYGCYLAGDRVYFNDAKRVAGCSNQKKCICMCDGLSMTERPFLPSPPPANYRFPYDNPNIILNGVDGCPDYKYDGENNAESCAAEWTEQCNTQKLSGMSMVGNEPTYMCKCGHPPLGQRKQDTSCRQCLSFNNRLPSKPTPYFKEFWPDLALDEQTPPITRRRIIERALGWVAHGFIYNNGGGRPGRSAHHDGTPETCAQDDDAACPRWHFSSVCQGLPSMAWDANNVNWRSQQKIDCLDLLPGDWVNWCHGHQMLFRRWTDYRNRKFMIYQMGGGWGKANAAIATLDVSCHTCWRRHNIIENGDCMGGAATQMTNMSWIVV